MIGVRDITRLCFSSNLAGIVANKIEQSFYSVYSYSGIKLIERALRLSKILKWVDRRVASLVHFVFEYATC